MSKEEKIVEIKKEEKVEKPKTKAKTQKPKKLTPAQVKTQLRKASAVRTIGIEIGGTEFNIEIDTVPSASKRDELIRAVKEVVNYFLGETTEEFELITNAIHDDKVFMNEVEILSGAIIVADIMRIFSDFEIENTLEAKQQFVLDMSDLGIFEQITASIPEDIAKIVHETTDAVSKEADKLLKEVREKSKQLDELEAESKEIEQSK